MRKTFLILGITAVFAAAPAFAELTVSDTTSTEYMRNHGYSQPIINATQKSAAQVNGVEFTPPVEHKYYKNPVVKAVRRLFMYVDPSYDDESFMNDHDIKTHPHYQDL